MNEQFGVGLYSAYFMAKEVSVVTKNKDDGAACPRVLCWRSFSECADQGEPVSWSTKVIHPEEDRPTEHLEEKGSRK